MLFKKELNYPDDFFSYANGVKISEDRINEWIEECLSNIDFNQDEDTYSVASGDSMVQVFKSLDNLEIYVSTSKGYSTFECELKDVLKKTLPKLKK